LPVALGRLGTGVVEVGALLGGEAGSQPLDLRVIEADAVERVLFAELFQKAGQRGVIPLRELVRLVVAARRTAPTPGNSTPSTHPPETTPPRGSSPRGGLTRCLQREWLLEQDLNLRPGD
jgi:hypothetical protein